MEIVLLYELDNLNTTAPVVPFAMYTSTLPWPPHFELKKLNPPQQGHVWMV